MISIQINVVICSRPHRCPSFCRRERTRCPTLAMALRRLTASTQCRQSRIIAVSVHRSNYTAAEPTFCASVNISSSCCQFIAVCVLYLHIIIHHFHTEKRAVTLHATHSASASCHTRSASRGNALHLSAPLLLLLRHIGRLQRIWPTAVRCEGQAMCDAHDDAHHHEKWQPSAHCCRWRNK